MTQKLFFVEVTKSGWVLADSEEDAKAFANEILDTEDIKEVDVFPYTEEYLSASGWKGGECIYHKGHRHKDITLFEAIEENQK